LIEGKMKDFWSRTGLQAGKKKYRLDEADPGRQRPNEESKTPGV